MERISPELLSTVLTAEFPSTASCWSQATDEVRDMCREARLLAGISEDGAVDFRLFNTPAQWNKCGVEAVVRFYKMLSEQKQAEFCTRFESWMEDWLGRHAPIQKPTKQ